MLMSADHFDVFGEDDMNAELADTLDAIADNIETYGHWQGQHEGEDFEALRKVSDHDPCCVVANDALAHRSADPVVHALGFEWPSQVYRWNDTTPTADVLAKLRQTAAQLRESAE